MNVLAFDTSSRVLTVASSQAEGIRVEANFLGILRHSENLFHLIDSVLKALPLELKEVHAYALGLGPGSFTGLRIGFSALKGFLAVNARPVYGFSSLDLIAQGVSLPEGRLAVVVNARRERIYASFYDFKDSCWTREKGEDEILSLDGLVKRCGEKTYLTGDALEEYGPDLRKKMPKAVFFDEIFWYPRAGCLVQLVLSRYQSMKPIAPGDLKPAYLRLSEAEEKSIERSFSHSRTS